MAARAELGAFEPLRGFEGVHVAATLSLRCTAIALRGGARCLYNPVAGLSERARGSLAALGPIAYIFAPNHYHHKALAEYAAAFPDARICASDAAAPRLAKMTGLAFADLSALAADLPDAISICEPEGLKTGEAWLRVRTEARTAWIVTDAIAGPKMTTARRTFEEPELLKTFPSFGVRDRGAYLAWLRKRLADDAPTVVVPCHGGICAADDLSARLVGLHEDGLGA